MRGQIHFRIALSIAHLHSWDMDVVVFVTGMKSLKVLLVKALRSREGLRGFPVVPEQCESH